MFLEELNTTEGITTVLYNNVPLHVCYRIQRDECPPEIRAALLFFI